MTIARTARATARSLSAVALAAALATPAAAQEPMLGAIEFVGFNFAPRNYALCDGQLMAIADNQALFSLLGTTFGGDGRTTFALPDLRGRSPVHDGGSAGDGLTRRNLGARGGAETVTLSNSHIPPHTHRLRGTDAAGAQTVPTGGAYADNDPDELYSAAAPNTLMHPATIGPSGAGPHQNMAPFQVVNCVIALRGIFPSRN